MSNHLYTIASGGRHIETRLLYVTNAKYEGDWHSTPHSHHFSEFFYVLGGRGRFLVDTQTFDVEAHDLVIVNPHVSHTEMSRANSPLEYIVLGIEGVCFSFDQPGADENYRLFHYRDKPSAARQEFLSYLHALLKEAEASEPYGEEVCQNLLEVLMIIMMRHSEFTLSVMPSKRANVACAQVKRHIDTHFRDALTLEELAERMLANPLTDGVTLSGGEPFLQAAECAALARIAREKGLNVWTYTGYTYEKLLAEGDPARLELLAATDVLVDGPFWLAEKSYDALFRGSRNQRLIDVPKSRAAGRAVAWTRRDTLSHFTVPES